MFGIGWAEFLFLAIIALLVLGPEKLPEIARQMGKWMRELRRVSAELRREFDEELYADDDGVTPFAALGDTSPDLNGDDSESTVAPAEGDFGAVVSRRGAAAVSDSQTPEDGNNA